jgi:hypothetical protein
MIWLHRHPGAGWGPGGASNRLAGMAGHWP